VADFAAELGITDEEAVERLQARNLKAKPLDTLRAVALSAGMRPFEVLEILKQGSPSASK
jgi:hypothetical protein